MDYATEQPERSAIDAMAGITVLDFGTSWCGHCAAAKPHVEAVLAGFPQIRHLRVEDGKGRPLGRSFGVKLWPTLVLLKDGVEQARLVRPTNEAELRDALARMTAP